MIILGCFGGTPIFGNTHIFKGHTTRAVKAYKQFMNICKAQSRVGKSWWIWRLPLRMHMYHFSFTLKGPVMPFSPLRTEAICEHLTLPYGFGIELSCFIMFPFLCSFLWFLCCPLFLLMSSSVSFLRSFPVAGCLLLCCRTCAKKNWKLLRAVALFK